jgi:carbon-monoxide dehydrogenase catalytic subunit
MVGICGADADTIASRNFARMIAAGTAAHSDHGREVTRVFLATARGELHGYEIRDNLKLRMVAGLYGIQTDGKSKEKIAEEIGVKALAEFGQQDGELVFLKRAPKKRLELWRELGIAPRGVDREVVELMHRTGMGTDQDYHNIMLQASRCALADGWGGAMIATELQDILFETPGHLEHERQVAHGEVDLGVLKEDEVNIVMHGHEPLLSEVLILASKDAGTGKVKRCKWN